MERRLVLVLDYGSQYTQLIARRIREQRVYCEIHPCTLPLERIRAMSPRAIVMSGGPSSVYDTGAPTVDPALFDLGVPILGICYGMQLFCHVLGGKVERAAHREYGPAQIEIQKNEGILAAFDRGERADVWMSHGDRVEAIPPGFEILAQTGSTPFAAVAHAERRIFGVQFHPEVVHTPKGVQIIDAFLFQVAKC